MLDMGVEDYLLTSTVNAIMAQRLVRRLDPDTRQAYRALPEFVEELGLRALTDADPVTLYRPGTSELSPTGYRGRTGIHEILLMSDEIRRMVMKHAVSGEIERQARREGMRTMYEDGLLKALTGETSAEEILRVTQEA
jgi:general secretion pathway protein E